MSGVYGFENSHLWRAGSGIEKIIVCNEANKGRVDWHEAYRNSFTTFRTNKYTPDSRL